MALGFANSLAMPMGSPVSSQYPYSLLCIRFNDCSMLCNSSVSRLTPRYVTCLISSTHAVSKGSGSISFSAIVSLNADRF